MVKEQHERIDELKGLAEEHSELKAQQLMNMNYLLTRDIHGSSAAAPESSISTSEADKQKESAALAEKTAEIDRLKEKIRE